MKLLAVLIDGGTTDVLFKYDVPFIRSLAYVSSLYCPIPLTMPSQTSIFTGKTADELGIHKFNKEDGSLNNSNDVKYPYVWELESLSHLNHGVVNIAGTYPLRIKKNTQFMISGFDSPGLNSGKNVYFPSTLNLNHYYLDVLHETKIHPAADKELHDKNMIFDWCCKVTANRTYNLMTIAYKYPVDIIIVNYAEFDRLMHFCFNEEELVDDYCRLLDYHLKSLFHHFMPDNMLVFSDHGFCHKDDAAGEEYRELVPKIGVNMQGVHTTHGMFGWTGLNVCSKDLDSTIENKDIFELIKNLCI